MVINRKMLKTSVTLSRYKSDIPNSKSRVVSLYDIKDISKSDISRKQSPPQTLRKENRVLKFLRKISWFNVDELVSNDFI